MLFLDDDAELMPGALELLVADLDAHPEAQGVTALVADGRGQVQHCGGTLEHGAVTARFFLDGAGLGVDDPALPRGGVSDWLMGTCALVRRTALLDCPLDPDMDAYYEDNDWSLRMLQRHGTPFRRCREAIALHHAAGHGGPDTQVAARDFFAGRLAVLARFLDVHGVLLDVGGGELRELLGADADDPAVVRLLLRLVTAYGPRWLLAEWIAGDLAAVLARAAAGQADLAEVRRDRDAIDADRDAVRVERDFIAGDRDYRLIQVADVTARLEAAEATLTARAEAAEAALAALEEERVWLHQRHFTLERIENGRLWKVRGLVRRVAGR